MNDLDKDEYRGYFETYVNKSLHNSLIDGLSIGLKDTISFFSSIQSDKFDFRYAEGKWTIRELLLHLIDAERVFNYRALRFARNDSTSLPGFDENDYVPESNASERSMESLIEEYELVRKSTIALFESFTDEALKRRGKAGNGEVSVRAIGYIITGHEIHHRQIIEERYL